MTSVISRLVAHRKGRGLDIMAHLSHFITAEPCPPKASAQAYRHIQISLADQFNGSKDLIKAGVYIHCEEHNKWRFE
jgi:hypothetical protein